MITDIGLTKETKIFKLSTQSSSGLCLNNDPNYKSSFQYSFPMINLREEDIELTCISIPYVSIPVSFYNIDYHNNRLDMIINGISTSFIFKSGNYNASSFMIEFKRLVDGFIITLDNITNCFTIMNIQNPFITFQFLTTSTISYVMGFSSSLSSTTGIYYTGNYIVLPRTCNFLHTPRIHLRCGELANGYLLSKNTESDILLSIPNDSVANGKIVYRNFLNTSSHLYSIPFIQTLTFNFTDEENNLINFNGISCYFEIQLEIYRKRPERPKTFRNLIRELSNILD